MGKYNFNYERITKLEAENAMLKEKVAGYDELKKRLEALESRLEPKKEQPKRTFVNMIEREKFIELFGITTDNNGGIVKTDKREIMENHSTIFKQNILKILMPKSYMNPSTQKHYVRFPALNDMSDLEYEIVAETFQSVCDTIVYAKEKLAKLGEKRSENK